MSSSRFREIACELFVAPRCEGDRSTLWRRFLTLEKRFLTLEKIPDVESFDDRKWRTESTAWD
jgi:hypothetical protein